MMLRTLLKRVRLSRSRKWSSSATSSSQRVSELQDRLKSGPELQDFLSTQTPDLLLQSLSKDIKDNTYLAKRNTSHAYLSKEVLDGNGRKVYFETYGCQMNVNDTQIASQILQDNGYFITKDESQADVVFLMTCSIRENAEDKIWKRLTRLKNSKKQVGLLGCMAERLKTRILEKEKLVQIIAGPDAYKDLPQLLAINNLTGANAVNVLLSLDETYAEVMPSLNNQLTSFISIMRGCDNMCSYCIVPFTRGRERSRPLDSIIQEVDLVAKKGVKEITLLGQNVNSYRDTSVDSIHSAPRVSGFKTVYKEKKGGLTFDHLLDRVAQVNPEVKIRFTSPHPKDFPDQVLDVIQKHRNVCKAIHLPCQSGSNSVLQRMRRGYTRETYLDLVDHIRQIIPGVSLSTDVICGFCGETEAEHQDTLDLMEKVKYNLAYVFAYSMREKTHAFHKFKDDVIREDKVRRVIEVNQVYRDHALKANLALIGQKQLVLVEGVSKKSETDLVGRTDTNTKLVFSKIEVPCIDSEVVRIPSPGDYLIAEVTSATCQTLIGKPLSITTLTRYYDDLEYR